MQGVTTVTSSPMSLSPLMRLENLIFIPDTWLNGLGSTNMAILRAPPSEKGMELVAARHTTLCVGNCCGHCVRSGVAPACRPAMPPLSGPACILLHLSRHPPAAFELEHLRSEMLAAPGFPKRYSDLRRPSTCRTTSLFVVSGVGTAIVVWNRWQPSHSMTLPATVTGHAIPSTGFFRRSVRDQPRSPPILLSAVVTSASELLRSSGLLASELGRPVSLGRICPTDV